MCRHFSQRAKRPCTFPTQALTESGETQVGEILKGSPGDFSGPWSAELAWPPHTLNSAGLGTRTSC